ncbi:MAG: tetratricopeptide repeat protein [Patescibacteria group bacterium]
MEKITQFFRRHVILIGVIFLCLMGIGIYANSFSNQMFWDDNDGIINNVYVKNFEIKKFFTENLIAGAGFQSNYWRPILLITYASEWKLWGDWTPGYHITNTLIHILNAILLFFLLAYISKDFFFRVFPSLIFLIHPLQTEAITYVSGRGDPLSFFFILLGILFYTKYRNKTEEKKSAYFYLGALFVFILALFTKERAVIFPAYLILFELWYWYKEKINFKKFIKKLVVSLLPFILIACIYLLLRGTALNFQNTFNIYNIETQYTTSIFTRTITFLKTIPSYIELYVFPKTLFMERSETVSYAETFFDPLVLIGICITLILIFLSLFKLKENPKYAFGTLFLFIAFFPASGIFIPVAGIIYEHYMYAPIIGISIILGLLIADFVKKYGEKTIYTLGIIIFIAWITFLSGRTIMRNAEWRDPITFYEQTTNHVSTSLRVWNNLGMAYADKKMNEKAIVAYSKAIALDPRNPIPYHNLGNIYENEKNIEMAKKYWQTATSLNPQFIQPQLKLQTYR